MRGVNVSALPDGTAGEGPSSSSSASSGPRDAVSGRMLDPLSFTSDIPEPAGWPLQMPRFGRWR